MTGIEQYHRLRKQWEEMLSREPESWRKERMQYLLLLMEGRIEEFFMCVSDCPPIFVSLLVLQENFLFFQEEDILSQKQFRDFCAYLPFLNDYSGALGTFWKSGLYI